MRFLPLAAVTLGFAIFVTGCSSLDKAQACVESSKIVTDTISKVTAVANDPQAMEKALNDGAAKLRDAADTAGNTTANQALQNLADTLSKINVKNTNDAIDAAQKVATDGAATAKKLAQECT
jgi:galactokinase/mevalonate kinase-like predicted kinase